MQARKEARHLDFSLSTVHPTQWGLTLAIVPGRSSVGMTRQEMIDLGSIRIQESAFFFLEPAIKEHWPKYRNYGHWGLTAVPRENWLLIAGAWDELRERLLIVDGAKQVTGLGFMFPEVQAEFSQDFGRCRCELRDMIRAVSGWVSIQAAQHSHLSIHGI